MRRIALCCCAAAFVGCTPAERGTDTVGATVGVATAAPRDIALSDVAGRWTVRAMPETADTTVVTYEINVTSDTTGWTFTLPGRQPTRVRVVSVSGDSIVTEAGPFESALRRGVQTTSRSVVRLRDGRLVGTTVARYRTTQPDSVLVLRIEATRIP